MKSRGGHRCSYRQEALTTSDSQPMKWLKALWSETAFAIWAILSALSTLATFFAPRLSGKPRLVAIFSMMVGFVWANLRVFQKQEDRIAELQRTIATHHERASELRITAGEGSRYILAMTGQVPHAEFGGGYFEFHLMIENI